MTDLVHVDPALPDAHVLARAAACLRQGGLVAFPTETVYGLGVHALDPPAVRRLFEAKGRPATDPLIVHVATVDDILPLVVSIPFSAQAVFGRFWPGPLTVILRRAPRVPLEVTAGLDTVALRVPAHPVAQALLRAASVPIAAPSANLFSRPSPTRASHVMDDLAGRIDMVLDGGPTTVGVESTVLDLTSEQPAVLRPGAITLDMLRELLPGVRPASARARPATGGMRSPGLLDKHYSPRAPLTLYEGDARTVVDRLVHDARGARTLGHVVGILCASEDRERLPTNVDGYLVSELGSLDDLAAVAAALYASLRQLDAAGVNVILARGFPAGDGIGLAIQDRLRRAAAGRIVDVDAADPLERRRKSPLI